jgi:hypothetical protein
MKVVNTFPPMYTAINRKFNVRGKPVIFTWGDLIHNPSRIIVSPELIVHEEVHSARQGDDPEAWWLQYLDDAGFRLCEEIPAHRAEFHAACQTLTEHTAQQRVLHRIAARLSSPLYGSMISYDEARWEVTARPGSEPQ